MNILGEPTLIGQDVILTGFYERTVTGNKKPKLFEVSSPYYPISQFYPPYDAILKSSFIEGGDLVAVGRKVKNSTDTLSSDRKAAFYFGDNTELIGTCHGFGRNKKTPYSGYNFYNSPYPMGYFQPPFGETTALFTTNQDGVGNLPQGACTNLSITEYNEQFGIVSIAATDVSLSTSTLSPGSFAQIMSVKETCPDGTAAVSTYYQEVNLKLVPGTVTSLTAPTTYNYNPIPTSLDNYDNWVNGRYNFTIDVPNQVKNITFLGDSRPSPSYSATDTNHSKLNNTLCYAQIFETDTAIGRLTNGSQRIETPDALYGSVGSQVSAAGQEPWHYWHFIYKENAETLPFNSDFKAIRPGITHRTISEGTQMFTPVLSSEDSYWQNRQCPDTVDFLPWNMGASIYACPSEHFDVPYYAAIKKFGFYGTRFLNSCKRLDLSETWNGVDNALELASPATIDLDESEPDVDLDGSWTFSSYDNLLRTASAEERYSNMYAMNKGFFLWANAACIANDSNYLLLAQSYDGFAGLLNSLTGKFENIYKSGFGAGEPKISIRGGLAASEFGVFSDGQYSNILFTNDAYNHFAKDLNRILSGDGFDIWHKLETSYGFYISNCQDGVNEAIYKSIESGREKRVRTRYFENIVRGNPVDLFPLNHIYFATDLARDYHESTGWSRSVGGFGKGSRLPAIGRRYFEGAYGNGSLISGVTDVLKTLSLVQDSSFYPGFFNTYGFGKMMPTPKYVPVESGYIVDTQNRKFSANGWLAVGYNEVGGLDKNFSCFTPIFTQQPIKQTYCKIGQRPTLRVSAVDYHTIPEDKINFRYPELVYWTHKLKIVDDKFRNKYPLQYTWFRVLKTDYDSFKLTANFDLGSFSNPAGDWCALEGNSNTCTIIHPKECSPQYDGNLSEDYYTFIQGVKKGVDDEYYYLCLVKGRFGVRISEPAELVVEDWLTFDVSQKNGMNVAGTLVIKFIINDIYGTTNTVTLSSTQNPAYAGYQRDKSAVPEGVVEQKIPPPNAGFGDVSASRFIGSYGYVGATRSYAPDTLKDTRGLREAWGRMLDYGVLTKLSKKLTQREGNLLYGYKALPVCSNYQMSNGQKGIRVEPYLNGNRVTHWTLGQQAFAAIDSRYGMKWDTLGHVGNLYPPAASISEIISPGMGIGHGQWGTNLGSIKRFGKLSTPASRDLVMLGVGQSRSNPVSQEWVNNIKDKLVQSDTLAGRNCGYTAYGLGRNMLYYIESFDRFYLICDPVKKKNVTNISFMCPGLRNTNSAIQYFWLGQPKNTYVERRPMYGPYAYQWRVKRHNRDRNGNGMSEGFYSPSYNTRYELMYDAPAIYGLYVKRAPSSEYLAKVSAVSDLRKKMFGSVTDYGTFRRYWFGEAGSEGSARRYGDFSFSCDTTSPFYNKDMCEYVSAAKDLANSPDFRAYSCPEDRLRAGACFDPCLSIRYGQGFFPGGKSQSMFGYTQDSSANLQPKNLKLVASTNYFKDALILNDEQSQTDPNTYFRAPMQTPHARRWRGLDGADKSVPSELLNNVVGVSPCVDGGSDHCNYMTPTIHLDTSSSILGQSSAVSASFGFAANVYNTYDTRGGD